MEAASVRQQLAFVVQIHEVHGGDASQLGADQERCLQGFQLELRLVFGISTTKILGLIPAIFRE